MAASYFFLTFLTCLRYEHYFSKWAGGYEQCCLLSIEYAERYGIIRPQILIKPWNVQGVPVLFRPYIVFLSEPNTLPRKISRERL